MELFFVYLWLKLDVFIEVCITFGIFAMLLSTASWIVSSGYYEEKKEFWEKRRNKFFIAGIILSIISVITPSSKDAAIIVGTYYALELGRSPEGQKVMSLIRKKANDFLDEQLKEVKK